MNNKGQTLVLFVLLLPLLTLVLGLVINYGTIIISKKNVDMTIKSILKTSVNELENKDKEEIKNDITKLININIGNADVKIDIDKKITIKVTKNINSLFDFLFEENIKTYTVTYEGFLDNNKVQIVRR